MKILKYPIPLAIGQIGLFDLPLPYGAEPLSVGVQGIYPVLWVLVHEEGTGQPRRFLLAGTGQDFSAHGRFIGTYQVDWFVGHLFEAHRDDQP
jgi:hypothetical protein